MLDEIFNESRNKLENLEKFEKVLENWKRLEIAGKSFRKFV